MESTPLLQPDWVEDLNGQIETVLHNADMYHLTYTYIDIKAIERILTVWVRNECSLFETLLYMKDVKSIKEWIHHYNKCIALKYVSFWIGQNNSLGKQARIKICELTKFAVEECNYAIGYNDTHILVETFILKIDTEEKFQDAKERMVGKTFREWYMSYSDDYQIYYLRKILLNRFEDCSPILAYNIIKQAFADGHSFEWLKTVCTSCDSWNDFKKNLGV